MPNIRFLKFLAIFVFLLVLPAEIASAKNPGATSEVDSSKPKVYFLFTQKEWVPDFIFKLSSVPVAAATNTRYGSSKFIALPITSVNVQDAFKNAEALVIGTHGIDGKFVTDDGRLIGPNSVTHSPDIKLIYFGSCYFGSRRQAWQAAFPNAKLIGYDGVTDQWTGWRYLMFSAPSDILDIK